jgi:diamine N-acetyltransferase
MVVIALDQENVMYVTGTSELLDSVEPLWHGLIEHMQKSSTVFQAFYASITFEKRKQALLKKTKNGEIHIAIAYAKVTEEKVGYCISSINDEKTGEIDSIFVVQPYRGFGVGAGLMKDALAWMDSKGAESKIVAVGAGNERVCQFYGRFGFKQRKMVLEKV